MIQALDSATTERGRALALAADASSPVQFAVWSLQDGSHRLVLGTEADPAPLAEDHGLDPDDVVAVFPLDPAYAGLVSAIALPRPGSVSRFRACSFWGAWHEDVTVLWTRR